MTIVYGIDGDGVLRVARGVRKSQQADMIRCSGGDEPAERLRRTGPAAPRYIDRVLAEVSLLREAASRLGPPRYHVDEIDCRSTAVVRYIHGQREAGPRHEEGTARDVDRGAQP